MNKLLHLIGITISYTFNRGALQFGGEGGVLKSTFFWKMLLIYLVKHLSLIYLRIVSFSIFFTRIAGTGSIGKRKKGENIMSSFFSCKFFSFCSWKPGPDLELDPSTDWVNNFGSMHKNDFYSEIFFNLWLIHLRNFSIGPAEFWTSIFYTSVTTTCEIDI